VSGPNPTKTGTMEGLLRSMNRHLTRFERVPIGRVGAGGYALVAMASVAEAPADREDGVGYLDMSDGTVWMQSGATWSNEVSPGVPRTYEGWIAGTGHGWQRPTFAANWADYDTNNTVRYRMEGGHSAYEAVRLSGIAKRINSPSGTSPSVMFNLSAKFRPVATRYLHAAHSVASSVQRIRVDPNGDVVWDYLAVWAVNLPVGGHVFLEGLTFPIT
jgi:hypothetical protein